MMMEKLHFTKLTEDGVRKLKVIVMKKPVLDAYVEITTRTNMKNKVSRQRKWQKEQSANGRCEICGKPLDGKSKTKCEYHRQLHCEYSREWNKRNKIKKERER